MPWSQPERSPRMNSSTWTATRSSLAHTASSSGGTDPTQNADLISRPARASENMFSKWMRTSRPADQPSRLFARYRAEMKMFELSQKMHTPIGPSPFDASASRGSGAFGADRDRLNACGGLAPHGTGRV